ncbi:class I SAM-dependent methyltransferase [Caballeronia sp.]|uniref:class I SAM-dependent methyltransferase n=1 Tax=Caballeronia sp. TaxID=1931223 RepID=UPI003C3E3517
MMKAKAPWSISEIKRKVKPALVAAVANLPDSVQDAMFDPRVRRVVDRIPLLRAVYTGCFRAHPIDQQLGTDTSGIIVVDRRDEFEARGSEHFPYMGSQPSIVRRALQVLGDLRGYTFIDIGCGKGRPLIVATEFPFEAILGYDISAPLVAIANRNAEILARRFPDRKPIRVIEADAIDVSLFPPRLVIFLFNPFGAAPLSALLRRIETGLAQREIEHLFIVYNLPNCADVLDASPALARCFERTFRYDRAELGYGSEDEQLVVIWQSVQGYRNLAQGGLAP